MSVAVKVNGMTRQANDGRAATQTWERGLSPPSLPRPVMALPGSGLPPIAGSVTAAPARHYRLSLPRRQGTSRDATTRLG